MNEGTLQQVTEIAAQVAKQIYPRYAVYFEKQDLQQELILWALRKKRVQEWLNPEQDAQDLKAGIKQTSKALQREADKYCRSAKAKASGYETRDEYFYNRGIIEELLTNLDELDHQTGGLQVRVSGGGSDPATGNNFAASIVDVRKALDTLEPQDQLILEMRFQEQQTFDQIADTLGVSASTVHRRVNAALKRMIRVLGGESPWISGRTAMSNAKAQALLD